MRCLGRQGVAAVRRGGRRRVPLVNRHPVVMFECLATDQGRLMDFYRDVFGWVYDVRGGFAYVDFAPTTTSTLGGIGRAEPATPGWSPGRNFYLATDDLEASLTAVDAAGGARLVPVTEAGGYRFAMFTDPENNVVGLLEVRSDPRPEEDPWHT